MGPLSNIIKSADNKKVAIVPEVDDAKLIQFAPEMLELIMDIINIAEEKVEHAAIKEITIKSKVLLTKFAKLQ